MLRLSLYSSHQTSLRNALTSRHLFEMVFQAFFAGADLRHFQPVLHKGGDHFACRHIQIVQPQDVVVLDGKGGLLELPFQNGGCPGGIRHRKTDVLAAVLFQYSQALLLQQDTVIENADRTFEICAFCFAINVNC